MRERSGNSRGVQRGERKEAIEKKKRGEGGSRRELREFKCKIKRIKPFVICCLPSDQPLVCHCLLDLLNQIMLDKSSQIYIVFKAILVQHFPNDAHYQKKEDPATTPGIILFLDCNLSRCMICCIYRVQNYLSN